jgi:hypothetical protein
MIGLIAKHWMEKSELSIFVCSVGYQGMLLDETLMSWVFRVFGMTPRALYVVPTAFLGLALILFHRAVKSVYGATAAHLAALAMLLASPSVYEFAARPQPNLGETWSMGLGLVLVYHRLSSRPSFARQRNTMKARGYYAALRSGTRRSPVSWYSASPLTFHTS